MKFFLRTALLSLSVPFCASAQFNCGSIYAQDRLFEQDPAARTRFEKIINSRPDSGDELKSASVATSFTIPVVFHILHKGGSENISDAQIKSAVVILNRDFQKQNADTANIVTQYKNLAANCSIQFSLATLDPAGNCTNGITRHYDDNTNWAINMNNYVYTWPPSKYLNVYVVNTMPSGIAGYAYLPGTASAIMDAVVILNDYVGNIGTGNNFTSRALTHEVGHWLNLQHTWGNTNNPGVSCGDDGVSDTPLTKGHTSCSLSNAIDCTSGVTENIQNYMEYSYCTNMYTQAQKTRMHNCLNGSTNNRNNLSANSNLISTGVINAAPGCAPKAEFITASTITCVGNNVSMTDYSYNGSVTSWNWASTFASNTSTLQNGSLTFTASGLAPVKLVAGNSFGFDSVTKQALTVLAGPSSGTVNFVESFETRVFPDSAWIASAPQNGGPFLQSFTVGATGNNCVWVNNFFDNPSGPVAIYSPAYNLQNSSSALLKFAYAYTQQNTSNNDQLKVLISTNCGSNWSTVYSKSGTQLNTTGNINTQAFLSPSVSEWKTETLNLQPFAGNPRLYFKFEFTPDVAGPGNNIFIDDINITNVLATIETAALLKDISVYPNPFNSSITIRNNSTKKITSVKLTDISSRELLNMNSGFVVAENMELKDFGGLISGIYFLEIKTGEASKVIKLIKQ